MEYLDPDYNEWDEKPRFLMVMREFPNLEKYRPGLSLLVYEYVRFLVNEVLETCNEKNYFIRCLESINIFYKKPEKRTHIGTLSKNISEEKIQLIVEIGSILSKMGDEIDGVPNDTRKKIKENLGN